MKIYPDTGSRSKTIIPSIFGHRYTYWYYFLYFNRIQIIASNKRFSSEFGTYKDFFSNIYKHFPLF